MARKSNSKQVILDAAEAVVMEVGAGHMSLDLVAKKAGVSKGGLMYNFPSKEALLKAMITRLIEQFYVDREKKIKDLKKSGPGAFLKAGILASFEHDDKRSRMGLSILAASAHNPGLLEPLKQAYQAHVKEMLDSGLKFEPAEIVSLAADGLMFWELFRLSPFNENQREKIKKEMLRMIDQLEVEKE
ncbi:MAG: TetR family transcriptional regulator [Candidatus Omnitrophica bacterium]|nr:TetR family transcriptional regulator [Candidatus Omnitrophota bacterium]